jgi:RecA-family ATPase
VFSVTSDDAKPEHEFEWLNPKKVSELTNVQPDQILRGMLYQQCKMVLMGGSKSFKTWTLMDIAYCVANGLLWWGIHTKTCPVIYLDFELLDYDFRWRMEQIAKAHGQGNVDAVRRIGIRGKTLGDKHWSKIYENMKTEGDGLAVSDPTYKLLGPLRDENSARDIAQVTAMFDRLTEETRASVIYAQHFSKGNQAAKESIDRGAGSGVWARDADAILTMTKHAQGEDYLTAEATLRSFPRIEPFVVKWKCPLFEQEPDLDPTDLKQPTSGREKSYYIEDLLDCLNGQDMTTTELETAFRKKKKGSETTFKRLLKEAKGRNLIHKCVMDQKWERVSR